ncbi:hypothetical protein F4677DRAFT_91748 [Hypoxylon crocopeplum]|nr:hypothetical protein F4677DRAFT_91748 [Hypoxylon crocopeplum]
MGKSTDKAGSVQAHIEQIVALLGSGNSPGQSPSNTQRSGRNKKKQSDSQLAFQAWFNNVDIQQVESVFSDCIKDGPEEEEEEEDPDPFPVPEKDQEWSDTVYNKLAASPEITKIFGTVISTSKKHDVEAKEIQDHLDMPAYPDTSPGGIMHFIKTEPGLYPEHIKSKDQKERQKAYQKLAADLMSKVQFCFRQQGSPKNATLQVLSGPEHQRQGFHQRYTCTGILHCETPNPKIFPDPSKDQSQYSPEFDRVDMSKLGLLHQEELENEKRKTSEERLRDRTLALFHAIVQLYQKEESFSCILEGCGNTCKNGVLRTFKRNGVCTQTSLYPVFC